MKTKINSIPGKMDTYWVSDVNAILDVVTNYSIPLKDFSEAILGKGLAQAKINKASAWIVDASSTQGALQPEIHTFIGTKIFPEFAKNGIKQFITIQPKNDAISRISAKKFTSTAGPNGLELIEVNSIDDAMDYLKGKR